MAVFRFVHPNGDQIVCDLPGVTMPPFRGKWTRELAASCGQVRAIKKLGESWVLLVPGRDASGRGVVVEVPAADGDLLDKVPEPPTSVLG